MLPTPPYDAYSKYPYAHRSVPAMQSLKYAPPPNVYDVARYDDHGYPKQYPQPATASALSRKAYHSDGHTHTSSVQVAQAHGSSNAYGLAAAPVLPPIRAPDRSMDEHPQQARSNRVPVMPQQQPKEEKIGGVAAHLDYKMDEMVNFVSEMAQGMYGIFASKICLADIDMTRSVINSKATAHPEFRRYVNQILSSTRLPSSTILLGLHYLAVRMTILSARGNYSYGGGDVYSLLTTALLLGSKFLDDNTFQNRSWSDVSNIAVKKLNALESEWLQDINWDMHFDPSDSKGFALWRRRWQSFQDAPPCKNIDFLVETMRKTSIDNNFRQQHNTFQPSSSINHHGSQHPEAGTVGHYSERSTPQWHARRYDQWASVQSDSEYSPPSAPETQPNTPDYAMSNSMGYGTLPPIYPSLKMPAPLHILASNAPAHGYLTPQYNHYAGHSNCCGCSYCMPYGERYSMSYAYDQAVAG